MLQNLTLIFVQPAEDCCFSWFWNDFRLISGKKADLICVMDRICRPGKEVRKVFVRVSGKWYRGLSLLFFYLYLNV